MRLLICLCIVTWVVLQWSGAIRTHAKKLYGLATLLAVFTIVGTALELSEGFPSLVDTLIWHPLTKGTLATALFVLVMVAGALDPHTAAKQTLMSVRAELAIIASILTLGHNLAAGQSYFVLLFSRSEELPLHIQLASICSLVMMAIMLPLFITSFPEVRRRMRASSWKQLQRLAYLFYAGIYLHVLLLYVPLSSAGNLDALVNVAVYSLLFVSYGVKRVLVATKKSTTFTKYAPVGVALAATAIMAIIALPDALPAVAEKTPASAADTASSEEATATDGQYKNGTFEGKGKGYAGPVYVAVTLKDDKITAIEVTEHKEDQPYWNRSLVTIDRILEEQTIDVDNVSGATKSVNGIKKAVKNALKNAEN